MRNISWILLLSLFISCNGEEKKVFTPDNIKNKLSQLQQDALALREKVYQQLLEEQLQLDSMAFMADSLVAVPDTVAVTRDTIVDCGTRLTIRQYDAIAKAFDNVCAPENTVSDNSTMIEFPVFFYIVTGKQNNGAITKAEVQSAFNDLQALYRPAKVQFMLKGIATLLSDQFYDFNEDDEFLILDNKKARAITVFIFNSLRSRDGQWLNGYASFKKGDDYVMITGDAIRNRTTFPHELGHYFTLYHTHGKTNDGTTDERVARNGCSCSGDDVCDTPADPNLLKAPITNCQYTGGQKDGDGVMFRPDPTNLMSYAHQCRRTFTQGQYNRIRYAALSFRNYLWQP